MNISSSFKKFLKTTLVVASVLSVGAFALPATAAELNLGGAQDCDANAVIYCGAQTSSSLISKYNNGTAQNSAKSIQDIYTNFGISSSEVNSIVTTAVAGRVTKTGEVYINSSSTPVASGAITAGRQNIAGSTQVTQNGTTFYTRPPSVSFNGTSIPAFVVMQNGVFQYAIISSCANPVKATPRTPTPPPAPQTTPKVTINKTVAPKGTNNYTKDITVKTDTRVDYRIEVTSNGTEAATNVNVKDVLPANVTYVPGTLLVGGKRATDAQARAFFSPAGTVIGSIAVGQTIIFRFEANVGQPSATTACMKQTLTNTGTVAATEITPISSTAVVNKECQPVKPMVTPPICTGFDIRAGENRTITVTQFDYTLNGATFVNAVINWDVNKTNASSAAITDVSKVVGQTYQYAADGTYLVSVTITFTQDGKTVTSDGVQCQKQVAFTTKPPVVTPPVTPVSTTPVTLVAAGPAANIAAAIAFIAIAGGAYYWSLRRRLSL